MTTPRTTTATSPAIPAFGVDTDPSSRPGVPAEKQPAPKPGARQPVQQQTIIGLTGTPVPGLRLTPVYGTAQPPRGLSGVLRRKAYAIPSHLTSHWGMLLMADRIDAIEHRPRRLVGLLAMVGLVAAGISLSKNLRR
jgi:hypothetical protein